MKKLIKRSNISINSVEKFGCFCNCWCLTPFTVDENTTNTMNAAK